MQSITILLSGILTSSTHVISGPDHIAAITPLAIESGTRRWMIGVLWGVGHLAGMLLIGLLMVWFREFIPIKKISEISELLVGLFLVGVGVWGLVKIKNIVPKEPMFSNTIKDIHLSSFGIGLLHGVAGIAHLILLFPILGFEVNADAILYLLGFAVGTIGSMALYAFLLEKIILYTVSKDRIQLITLIRYVGSFFALIVGTYWIYLGAKTLVSQV